MRSATRAQAKFGGWCVAAAALLAGLVPSVGMSGCASSGSDGGNAGGTSAPARQCAYTVWHKPASAQSTVELVGDFEGWTRPGRILPATRSDGWRVTQVQAAAGEHTYLIYEDGVAVTDSEVATTAFRPDGTEVTWVDVADCSKPGLAISGSTVSKAGEGSVTLALTRATSGAAFAPGSFSVTSHDGAAIHSDPPVIDAQAGTATMALHQLPKGKNTLTIEAKDVNGTLADTAVATLWVEDEPFDLHDTITYQIMVDRFANEQGPVPNPTPTPASRAGGNLAGVKAALDSGMFSALGVNTLWLSPLYQNPTGTFAGNDGRPYSSYHGYWPSEPRTIEDLYGGEDALDTLITDVHAHGMRILFDVVPNHVHAQHPYAQQHLNDDWFNHPDGSCICGIGSCDWTTHDTDCWFEPYLPDLSWMNPAQVDQCTSDVQWWIDRFDGDGIRIDAVPNMPRAATRRIVNAIRTRYDNPGHQSFLLGENFTGETGFDVLKYELGPFGLTSEFHFPLMYALRSAVAYAPATPSAAGDTSGSSASSSDGDGADGVVGGSGSAVVDDSGGQQTMVDVASVIQEGETDWTGSGAIMSTIIGNHDVTRFETASSGDEAGDTWTMAPQSTERVVYDKQIFALSTIFTLPGAPVIYYGDEVGLAGRADPDSRRVYPTESELSADQMRVRAATQKLGLARACSNALRRGDYGQIFVDPEHLVFSRTVATTTADGGSSSDTAIVTLSRLPLEALPITLPGITKGVYTDLLSGATTTLDPELTTLDLTPFSVHVYVPSTSSCAASATP
jgi:glycosidase